MPRYYFNLINEVGSTMDLQGEDFPDDATALEYASALARDLGKPTKAGRWSVEVLDAERRPVSVG